VRAADAKVAAQVLRASPGSSPRDRRATRRC